MSYLEMQRLSEWQTEVSGDRRLMVTHSGGDRWFFQFPQEWRYGTVPEYQPAVNIRTNYFDSSLSAFAAMYALEKARREHWVS